MKKLFSLLLIVAVAGGITWYENQPTTVEVPLEVEEPMFNDDFYVEETTTVVTETTQPPAWRDVDFSTPDVTMEFKGDGGDDVTITEVIGKPQHLSQLSDEVRTALMGCEGASSGVTDRDMVMQIDSKVELQSSLPAEVHVDYNLLGYIGMFQFTSGLTCDEGKVKHTLEPGTYSHLTYWVVLSGVITPDHPDGDFSDQETIWGPGVVLPNAQAYSWKIWGPRVYNCYNGLADISTIWLEGPTPSLSGDICELADTEETALADT